MCGIAVFWNHNIAVKFLEDSFWDAKLLLLAIDEKDLFVISGCCGRLGLW